MKSAAQTPIWLRQTRYVGMLLLLLAMSVAAHWLMLSLVPFRLTTQEPDGESSRFDANRAPAVVWTPSDSAATSERRNDVMTVFDPTLIAFSNERGFANRVSRGMPPIAYRPQPQQQQPRLTDTTQFAQTRAPVVAVVTLPQELAERWTKLSPSIQEIENLFLPTAVKAPPSFELRGSLSKRPLLIGFQLPEIAEPPAKPCVFSIAVDGDGRVRSVMLKGEGSGNAEADRLAADALSRCVFTPSNVAPRPIGIEPPAASQPNLEWSEAIIFWKAKTKPAEQPNTP